MRVLHITTSLTGGAGIAARRICQAQSNFGLDSVIMGIQVHGDKVQNEYEIAYNRNFRGKLMSSLVTGLQQKIFQKGDELLTPISISTLKINDNLYKEFNLIHIHSFYNLLSLKLISQIAEKIPVVVTLHDQRFFTGGCHYSLNCHKFKSTCTGCPQAALPFKFTTKLSLSNSIKFFENLENITYITPSQWLANSAAQSRLLSNKTFEVITNPIPTVYSRLPEVDKKDGRFVIGFFSYDLNNPYKGLETIISAAHILKNKSPIELKFYGKGKIKQDMTGLIYSQGSFIDDESAAEAYNSCDVVVVPSIQDNNPSVISEALMCGVPVVSTDVGGISEVLKEFNLPLVEPQNPKSLAEALLNLLGNYKNHNLSSKAHNFFSCKLSATRHEEVYQRSLLRFKNNSIK